MAVEQDYIGLLVNIPGFSVGMVGTVEDGDGVKGLMIELRRREARYRCRCGREFTTRHDS